MSDKSGFAEQMPATIGRYQVQGSIGYGAMGAVYKAFDPLIKRTLAIKTIRLDIPRQSPQYKSFIERFYHEARISGTLSHPNIVTLFDIGEEAGIPYLAMEFVEGETISSIIDRGQRFPPEKVIGLVSQIASAVDYAHGRGVIHRDIKPSNLILSEGDRVKVTDFGIAKLVDAEMTQSGTLLGTPSYMSPEQAMGEKLDGRSDIFSLGVCAFEMLSGEQPFPGTNVTSILYKLVHVDPIEPANLEMNGLVPQKWHEVFGKVLAKKADDRYQNGSEFVQDLEYCLGSWFGAAMGDNAPGPASVAPVAARPLAAPVNQEATSVMPSVKAGPPPAAEDQATTMLPTVSAPPKPAPPKPAPATPAPAPPPDEGDAMTLRPGPAPQIPPPTRPKEQVTKALPSVRLASPPVRPTTPPPLAPEDDEPAPTVHMKAPVRPAVPEGATVAMVSPVLAAPPPPPEDSDDGATVVMAAQDMVLAPPVPAEPEAPPPTVSEPVPDLTRPAPIESGRGPTSVVSAPTQARPRSGVPAALIVGAGAAVFVLAMLVAGGLWLRSRRAPEATPEPTTTMVAPTLPPSTTAPEPTPSAPPPGSLHVESTPAGASVTVNGEVKGVTPLDVPDLPLAAYQVKTELKGYLPDTQSVTLSEETPRQELKLALKAAGPAMGVADVLSTPFGATVKVDGSRVGQTPLTDYRLRPGSHQFEISKEGYEPHLATVKVDAGRRARVDAQLKEIVKATPTPTPADVVDPNRIYQNTPSEVDTPAKKTSGVPASYPENAPKLRSGEGVSTSISFVVTETGDVADTKVVESGGRLVDEAVMAAIRGWKYAPAVKKGIKVKVRIVSKLTFRAG
jgi:TonB family protein